MSHFRLLIEIRNSIIIVHDGFAVFNSIFENRNLKRLYRLYSF